MDVFGYLIELKQNKVYTHKQYKYIDRIVLYTNNGKCYRIAVFAEPKYFHKAKKVGITEMVKVLDVDKNITTKLTDISKGKFILQYYVKLAYCQYLTERSQFKNNLLTCCQNLLDGSCRYANLRSPSRFHRTNLQKSIFR
ncbi:hypothetical protein TVAGG3_0400470, partial [Trichomonas vaginalis G3]|uniref:hypothetical protein n=1 Tax=Trichomonas vaginalis (strain ATCC PRA-98 / G3) TaxID=412133 RepID=UPI0021E58CC9